MEDRIRRKTSSCLEICEDLTFFRRSFNFDSSLTGLHFGSLKYCIVGLMMKYTIRETTKNSVYGMANMFGKIFEGSEACTSHEQGRKMNQYC